MKILVGGPKICSPWTEGRKRFTRDLVAELAKQHEVMVLTTTQPAESVSFDAAASVHSCIARGGVRHLFEFHRNLERELSGWRPDLVCHVPISSFHGRYKIGNISSMWLADRQCRRLGVECFTLMYAIVKESSAIELNRWVSNLFVNQYTAGGKQIRFGAARPASLGPHVPGDGRSLLFMAGMAECNRERLEHVLRLRGLDTLLMAGATLASRGFSLTIAVPLLESEELKNALVSSPANSWPIERLRLLGSVDVPEIFNGHDFFVFPYARDETQFVPNSVVEAMYSGVPTVLPSLPFLGRLIEGGRTAYTYKAGDVGELINVLSDAADDDSRRRSVSCAALQMVNREFNIAGTAQDIISAFESLR